MNVHNLKNVTPAEFPRRLLTPFGIELRKLRVEKRLRIYDLAQDLKKLDMEVSSSTVSAWETGRRDIKTEDIQKIAEYFSLNDEELEKLKKAADSSRARVTIKPNSPEARLLANAFKRKINSLSPEIIQELLRKYFTASTRIKRPDKWVAPKRLDEIVSQAQLVRSGLNLSDSDLFDVVEFIEFHLDKIAHETIFVNPHEVFHFEVWDDDEMPKKTVGMSSLFPPKIVVSNRVYEDAAKGDGGGRWILAHELGHVWLLHGSDDRFSKVTRRGPEYLVDLIGQVPDQIAAAVIIPFQSPKNFKKIPFENSAEGQADEFAAELLMPRSTCSHMLPYQIRDRYSVSLKNATKRKEILDARKDRLH